MTGAAGKLTELEHVTSPWQVAVLSRLQGCPGVVTYLPPTFFVTRLLASGEAGRADYFNSHYLKKYIIPLPAGRKAQLSATLAGDEISCDGSLITSPCAPCSARSTATSSETE